MAKRLIITLCLILSGAISCADEKDAGVVNTLLADLAAVVEQGKVEPVNGVTTAGQPDEAGFKVFAANGYVAVIDMRTEGEGRGLDEPAVVEALGMEYISFPIDGDGITFENARKLEDLIASYDQPVLVHCASSNRVGALFALNEYRQTKDVEKALQAGKEAGMTRLESVVKKVLSAD